MIATFVVLPRPALDPADSAEQARHLDVLRPRDFQALSGTAREVQRKLELIFTEEGTENGRSMSAWLARAVLAKETNTSGGSMETEVKPLIVAPRGSPSRS